MTVRLSVDLSGPFFQGDPGAKLGDNIRRMMAGLAEEGQRLVMGELRAGESSRQALGMGLGRVSDHVRGRVKSLTGKQWKASAVISVNNSGLSAAQGIKLMAAASGLEARFKPFRRTTLAIGRSRKILSANLAQGLE